ncbi:hypothetical protein BGY98DRAFT_1188812 [Russula aff. rugulosa BPL654]|nr:hypothetical protein BGY98DRAFT_1188812 [Russula aff. rugulosa BPL654]
MPLGTESSLLVDVKSLYSDLRQSSISTPTSPIDPNVSFVGTLEYTIHPSADSAYAVGSVPSYAHDWPCDTTGGILTHSRPFIDAYGRVCNLRGVNLSGNCKAYDSSPVNDNTGNATFPTGAEFVTFVGRPFPLDEALQHFLPRRSTLQVNDDQSDLDAVTTVAFTVDSPLPRLSGSLLPR